jgi:hypothetical protein
MEEEMDETRSSLDEKEEESDDQEEEEWSYPCLTQVSWKERSTVALKSKVMRPIFLSREHLRTHREDEP